MEQGLIRISHTMCNRRFLVWPSFITLVFEKDETYSDWLIPPGKEAPGYMCQNCKTTVFSAAENQDLKRPIHYWMFAFAIFVLLLVACIGAWVIAAG